MAVILVVGTILVAGPTSPWVEAVLSQGRAYLDVPLSTMYTAPLLVNNSVNTSVLVSYSSGFWLSNNSAVTPSFIFYAWSVDSRAGLPVKFLLESSWPSDPSSHFEDVPNHLEYLPAGPMPRQGSTAPRTFVNATISGPGVQAVLAAKWAMDYTVRKMGVFQGLTPTSYLEVDYTLCVLDPGSVRDFASTNVTAPIAADLVATSAPLAIDVGTTRELSGIGFSADTRSPYVDYEPFNYTGVPVALDAGSLGVLNARLTSSSEWFGVCASMNQCWFPSSYTLSLSFSNQTAWVQVYLDRRFGSLFLEYVPPPVI